MISHFLVLNAGENDTGSTTSVSMSSTARSIPFSDWAYSLQVPLQGYFRACHVPTGADKKDKRSHPVSTRCDLYHAAKPLGQTGCLATGQL